MTLTLTLSTTLTLTLSTSPQGGVMAPRERKKKGTTINEVPSRRGLWPAERNIGSWFT